MTYETVIPDENGVSNKTSTLDHYHLVYHEQQSLYYGKHDGEITTKYGVIECMDTELDLLERIKELELYIELHFEDEWVPKMQAVGINVIVFGEEEEELE